MVSLIDRTLAVQVKAPQRILWEWIAPRYKKAQVPDPFTYHNYEGLSATPFLNAKTGRQQELAVGTMLHGVIFLGLFEPGTPVQHAEALLECLGGYYCLELRPDTAPVNVGNPLTTEEAAMLGFSFDDILTELPPECLSTTLFICPLCKQTDRIQFRSSLTPLEGVAYVLTSSHNCDLNPRTNVILEIDTRQSVRDAFMVTVTEF
jgi:hypothetical protein